MMGFLKSWSDTFNPCPHKWKLLHKGDKGGQFVVIHQCERCLEMDRKEI